MTNSESSFRGIDAQLAKWAPRLVTDLNIDSGSAQELGTAIAREVSALAPEVRLRLRDNSPVRLSDRLDELRAFQAFMDGIGDRPGPAMVRAQVILQNYICFVYLGESCFRTLRKILSTGPTKHCCVFLTDNPIRALRNAFAHANWRYKADYSGLEFWAREGSRTD